MTITAVEPADDPPDEWATDPSTRVAASAGQQATGWTNGQRPTFNVFNWLLGLFSDWILYYREVINEMITKHLDRDGSVTIAGILQPDVGTRDLGVTGTPFQTFYVKNVVCKELLVMAAAARVSADMLPSADGIDLGSDALRYDAFLQSASIEMEIAKPFQVNVLTGAVALDAAGKSFIEISAQTSATIANITNPTAGQRLTLVALDSGITIDDSGNVGLVGGTSWTPNANDSIEFIYSATQVSWIELHRAVV